MGFLKIFFIVILMLLAIAMVSFILYFSLSPMMIVNLIRKKMKDYLTYPPKYDDALENIEIKKDLKYKSKYGKNTYDFYLPKAEGSYPLILWVHGGAFVAGDKSGIENWGVMLAAKGYATATINYELAPEAAYPAPLQQITDAIKTISETAKDNKIDMNRVVIAGDSAGAHMAAQFSLIHTNNRFSEKVSIKSPLAKDALKGALLYCGPYDLEAVLNIKNKFFQIFVNRLGWSYLGKRRWQKHALAETLIVTDFADENFVPCYITDGNTGSFETHGRMLADYLRKKGVYVKERYFSKETAGEVEHEYQMRLASENAQLCFSDTVEFLNENID